jgi:outer membrane receptor protein involved in Fe transport
MPISIRIAVAFTLAVCLLPPALPAETIDELVVTSQRREQPRLLHPGNIARLDARVLDAVAHHHMHELLNRVAGTWISRGSGQEHLTAIRSPVLTGAGSCGAFLFLEDGIPIRPAGFCNVNGLLEANTEQARSIEVIRGPANALYGSNALHGITNVLMPMPGPDRAPSASLEVGANDFYRVGVQAPFAKDSPWFASLVYADDGGFRDDAGYQQLKLHSKLRLSAGDGDIVLGFSATDLDQETAGFIVGEDAYKDSDINRSNPNPEAFREASAQRLYGIWSTSTERFKVDVRPFLRHSDMEFLQHFLPGQPLEENGHVSAGALATFALEGDTQRTIFGVDVEWADMFLKQTQDGPTVGSPFLVATRPEGKHYDYDVTSANVAAYVQTDWAVDERFSIAAGLRLDYIAYDYDNRMLDGNTRDDGTPCGFGGCLYSRPADRSDSFTNFAPKVTLSYRFSDTVSGYGSLSRGFRAPQATELYRLQSGQEVADLKSERIESFEVGVRQITGDLSLDLAYFAMSKRGSVYRDAEGFNVTGAASLHRGVEAAVDWQFADAWSLALNATYARHTYDFDAVALRGETFVSGRDVDTAPRWLGSLELRFAPSARFDAALQLASIGKYYLDAENRFDYPGHTIANLRAGVQIGERLDVILRLNNVTDRDIADRADYAFGNYRYFPGRGRELFAEIRYTP